MSNHLVTLVRDRAVAADEHRQHRKAASAAQARYEALGDRIAQERARLAQETASAPDAVVVWRDEDGLVAGCTACDWTLTLERIDVLDRIPDWHADAHRYGQRVTVNGRGLSARWGGLPVSCTTSWPGRRAGGTRCSSRSTTARGGASRASIWTRRR